MRTFSTAPFLLALAAAVSATNAATVKLESTKGLEGLGAYTADISYDYGGSSTAKLTLSVTNTSISSNSGYLTAIAFGGFSSLPFTISSTTAAKNFSYIGSKSGKSTVSASPFGDFALGFSTSKSSWLGGGTPSLGLAPGQTGTFTLNLTGSKSTLSSFSVESFLGGKNTDELFVARFRGFTDGGSDKVAADYYEPPECDPTPPNAPNPSGIVIPLPTASIAGLGLFAIIQLTRLRR